MLQNPVVFKMLFYILHKTANKCKEPPKCQALCKALALLTGLHDATPIHLPTQTKKFP